MSVRKALASALQLFAVLLFFTAGLLFISLPFLPKIRFQLADVLINSAKICEPIGIGLLMAAFLFFAGFFGLSRGRVLRIEMGNHAASVDAKVIHKALDDCFKRQFAKQISLSEVGITLGKKLEIEVCLAPIEEDLREELFTAAQKQLQAFLRERFGYAKPFSLIVKS